MLKRDLCGNRVPRVELDQRAREGHNRRARRILTGRLILSRVEACAPVCIEGQLASPWRDAPPHYGEAGVRCPLSDT
jgi:hypothetical protein